MPSEGISAPIMLSTPASQEAASQPPFTWFMAITAAIRPSRRKPLFSSDVNLSTRFLSFPGTFTQYVGAMNTAAWESISAQYTLSISSATTHGYVHFSGATEKQPRHSPILSLYKSRTLTLNPLPAKSWATLDDICSVVP